MSKTLAVALFVLLLAFNVSAATIIVGTVNISSGAGTDTVTGTSLSFSPPCDTSASAASIALLGGCVQGEVGAYGPGTLGTPSGPLESTGPNGTPPVGSGVFIAPFSVSTIFPLSPAMKFVNSTSTGVGISVAFNSVGPGAQTNCLLSSAPNAAGCSIYAGSPIVIYEDSAGGTHASLTINGVAWDGGGAEPATGLSNFFGSFTTQLTFVTGITGTGPGGQVTPDDIQKFFGCPDNGTATIGSCTKLTNSFQSSNSGTFSATFSSVPEPDTVVLMGAGLILFSLGFKRWRKS